MSWFSGGKNPAHSAQKYLDEVPGEMGKYYDPYIDQGKDIDSGLIDQYKDMSNDPNKYFNKLGEGYTESPGYQNRLHQALTAGSNASAAGGMLGTNQHQQNNANIASDVAGADYEQYMNHIMQTMGLGLQGQHSISDRAAGASMGMGNAVGSNLSQQANYAYQGTAAQNAAHDNMMNNLFGLAGAAIGGPKPRAPK